MGFSCLFDASSVLAVLRGEGGLGPCGTSRRWQGSGKRERGVTVLSTFKQAREAKTRRGSARRATAARSQGRSSQTLAE